MNRMASHYEFNPQTIIAEGRTSEEAILEIRNWISIANYPEIPDQLIVLFLLSCQNVITNTQNTIKAYFKVKAESPEIFSNRDIDSKDLIKIREVVSFISIPRRLENNGVVHYFSFLDSDYRKFDWVSAMKVAFMVVDVSQKSNPPEDLVVILDMKGMGFMHVTRLRIGAVKNFLAYLQEAMPLRIRCIHILNTTYLFDKLLSLVKVFIKSDLMEIIKTHPPDMDLEVFHKNHVPAACLPKEHGGELASVEELSKESIEKFRSLKDFFQAEEKLINFKK